MGLPSFVKGKILGSVVSSIAKSEPRTTALGFVGAGLIAANIDYGKLLQGDKTEEGKAIGAMIVALFGWFTNHSSVQPQPKP